MPVLKLWNGSAWVEVPVGVDDHGNLAGLADVAADHPHGISAHTEHANWKVLYTDSSGDETELALGADGTFLQANGVAAAPTFAALVIADIPYDDATSDPLIDADSAADGTEGSPARKDHVHPKHHAKYTDAEAISAVEGEATLDLAGDVTIAEFLAIGDASIQDFFVLNIDQAFSGAASTANRGISSHVTGGAASGGLDTVTALRFQGRTGTAGGAAAQAALGMAGWAGIEGSNDVAILAGAESGIETVTGASGAVTSQAYALYAQTNRASATPKSPLTWGVRVADFSGWAGAAQTAYGVQIDEFDGDATGIRRPIWYGDTGDGLWYLDEEGRQFMKETSAPTAVANRAALYVDTGGAGGRQRLMCIFETGVAQVLATEP